MNKPNPPAFPVPPGNNAGQNGEILYASEGMSLREWYAGQALIGLLAHGGAYGHLDGATDFENIAYFANKYADAMLDEREKG